jgi:ABC-type sugar transport system permease subunit
MSDTTGGPSTEPSVDGSAVLVAERPAGQPTGRARKPKPGRAPGERAWLAGVFLAPAVILLVGLMLYPLVYSIVRSLFNDGPAGAMGSFAGIHNYYTIFTDSSTLRAVKNNLIWLVVTPTLVTILGLIFAVLSERIRWATVFKTVLFVPMAISGLAVGVTFALIYSDQPSRGLANTVTIGIHDIFGQSTAYPNNHPLDTGKFPGSPSKGFTSKATFSPGTPALLPLVGLDLTSPPAGLAQAKVPSGGPGLSGVVWNDFKLGGGGTSGKVDPGELGLKGMTVQAVRNGSVVASATSDANGIFRFPTLTSGSYQLRLPSQNFAQPFAGFSWLGPNLITPAIIISYLWVYAGFAMVLLAAGMSAIPRDALEAARIDGATEWQVFRRVTAPLLAPVLMVVFVTMVINVLKVFDLVFIISQSAGANGIYANVLAVELFNNYGNQQYGLASAIGVVLVIVLIPAMIFNIRRFRREQQ